MPLHPRPPPPPAPARRRALGLAALVLPVLLLHAWLLAEGPPPGAQGRHVATPARALQVRQIVAAAPVRTVAPTPAPVREPAARRAAAAAPETSAAAAAPVAAAAPEISAAAPEPEAGVPLPVYATRPPPAATLQFGVQREGAQRGAPQAELRWRPEADGRYTLTLGLAAAGWASVGRFDENGLAPERQVETRRGREVRAANFQRERGRISFSGPAVEYPLWPGAQDRLSWLLQLAAVLEAEPALGASGQALTLFVAGPRGDGRPWVFVSRGAVAVDADGGPVPALHLQREPAGPYDTRVDVWLDPARHHLPVRMRLQNRAEGEATEFALQAIHWP